MKNMREACNVIIIDPVGKKAGLDHYNDSLAKSLNKLDVLVRVYSNYKSEYSEPVFKFRFGKSIFFLPEMFFSLMKVFKNLKQQKPDIVILHLFNATRASISLSSEIKKQNIKLVYILHDIESLIDEVSNNNQLNICLQLADEIVVHNHFTASELLKKNPGAEKKVIIIPHGDFLELPSSVSKDDAIAQLGLDKKMPKVLFFGMIKPTKGLDVLLKAMQKINAQVIVAGRVRKQSMSDYTEAFSDLKKQGKLVTDINYITNEKRDLYFKSADVIVLPYTKIYQSGVLLMAMSYGIPVIASDLQPNLELASEIDCMEFFRVGDHLMLERVMSSLLANRDRRDVLRKNGFSVLESSHNWNKIANSFKQIICR
mgnify:FL=1